MLIGALVDAVKAWWSSTTEWVISTLTAKEIVTEEITLDNLTIKEKDSDKIYCLKIVNGKWEKGELCAN